MSVTHGMNIEEVRRLGGRLQEMSSSIDVIRGDLDRLVARTTWVGPTAEQFIHHWWPTNRARLVQLSDQVHGLGQAAFNSADEQERISGGGTVAGSLSADTFASAGFLKWVSDNDVIGGLQTVQSVAGVVDDVKGAYYATMIGLTSVGMAVTKSDTAFAYFRSAKGGFTTQYGKLAGRAGTVVSGAINAVDYAMAVKENGWGSSEAAASAFEGTLSTGASMVPAGGLAFEGGMAIGNVMYEHTPLGGYLESRVTGGMEGDLNSISAATDSALAAGDFEEARRLNGLASDVQSRMATQTSGYRGLLNSVGAVLNPIRWMR